MAKSAPTLDDIAQGGTTETTSKSDTKADAKAAPELSPVARVARSMTKQLPGQDIQTMGSKFNTWGVMAPADHTIADVLSPRYLWAKSEQMKRGDYIEIKHIYGRFVVCLDVVAIDHAARGIIANIRNIYDYTQPGAKQIKPSLAGARVEFLGARGWAIVDGAHVARDGFEERTEAEKWLDEQRLSAA